MPAWKQQQLMMNPKRAPGVPSSRWFEQEKQVFQPLVAASGADLLIAPVQVQLHGLDRSTRALMTARIAQRLSTTRRVANPASVDRALGEGLRRLDVEEVLQLARTSGAKRVLVTYAGHDGRGALSVAMQAWDFDQARGLWIRTPVAQSTTPIRDGEAIADAFASRMLVEMLANVGENANSASSPKTHPGKPMPRMPGSLSEAFQMADSGPIGEAAYCQLLGMLAPRAPERALERLFERSLLALERSGISGDEAKLLRARALYYLHSRPAALAALGEPRTNEQRAFRAFLDGDLPALTSATRQIPNDLLRTFAEFELRDLQVAYGLPVGDELPAFFADAKPQWRALIARRLTQGGPWKVQQNVALKRLLDETVPLAGFDLGSTAKGEAVLGTVADEEDLGLLVFDHVQRARRSETFLAQCPLGRVQCPRADLLDLVEAVAISNATRAISRAALTQAAYQAADRLAAKFAAKLAGQPEFELVQSESLLERGRYAQANPALSAASREHAISAMYWEQGQSSTSFRGVVMGARTPEWIPLVDEYLQDIPARSYWSDQVGSERDSAALIARYRAQLRESVWDIGPAQRLRSFLPREQHPDLGREIQGRFRGHPQYASIADLWTAPGREDARRAPDHEPRIASFLAAQAERPDLWSNYRDHGDYLVHEKGDYAKAAEAYLRFPGFTKSDGYGAVELSNHAFESGSMLYFRGDFTGARKLYGLSAAYETGSRASMESATRLELLDSRYANAAQGSQQVAARYGNAYAVRDYLSWIFVFGFRDEGWAGFDQVAARLENPQAWSAAHVGKRLEGRNERQLREWLQSEPIRTAGSPQRFALLEAVLLNSVDRKPWPDLAEFLAKLEGKPLAKFDSPQSQGGTVAVPAPGGFNMLDASKLRTVNPGFKDGEPVSSHLVYFARGYVPLRDGKYAEAADRFQDMAQVYAVEGGHGPVETAYVLPYYAWASARSGDKHGLESFLDKREANAARSFDHQLAKAVFTGLRGERDASVAHLERAFNRRPFTESRPIFTEYQWAETCEWLFEATGDVRYRELALKMARINQKIQPFFAWSYAMEAKLSPPGPARQRALGITLYLDRGSERIARFPDAEIAAASAWFDRNNPFKLDEASEKQPGRT